VLRMVAVQQHQPIKMALQELRKFQTQASTRGSGGFPNAFIAGVDLFNPRAIAEVASQDALKNLRGVWHCFTQQNDVKKRYSWERSLSILTDNNLSLDLLVTQANEGLVSAMAKYKPQLNIIVEFSVVEENQNRATTARIDTFIEFLKCLFEA